MIDLERERLQRQIAKLEANLADLEVRWVRDQAWADEVVIILDRMGVEYPVRPKFD